MKAALARLVGPPMAAPETRMLRALRRTIMGASLLLGVLIAFLGPANSLLGVGAIGAAAGLLALLIIVVPIYLRVKLRVDGAYLTVLCQDGER